MRETRVAQASIFECYSEHEFGARLNTLSCILDKQTKVLPLVEKDLLDGSVKQVGRNGLSVETIFRCLLLKQQLQISYEQFAFHLSDSLTYRTFTRLPDGISPSRSCLQSTIRSIKPETLSKVFDVLSIDGVENNIVNFDKLRIDSSVVASNIAPPSDSQLLCDGIRVLSRNLAKCHTFTGIKRLRFVDQRKASKALAFKIFHAKNAIKEVLYPDLLKITGIVMRQVERALLLVKGSEVSSEKQQKWLQGMEHYYSLMLKIIDQTERRVIKKEKVLSSEKIVSVFEPHTDIIVKGFRDIQYGHKINLSSEQNGFITHMSIEDGNPSDTDLFIPVLNAHQEKYGKLPNSVVADGGYASRTNVLTAREMGAKRVVFHKRVGISLQDMGVKTKTFKELRNFRAGVEGNISELKRTFGASKARWKGHDGFKAFVWASAISYNLMRMARLSTA